MMAGVRFPSTNNSLLHRSQIQGNLLRLLRMHQRNGKFRQRFQISQYTHHRRLQQTCFAFLVHLGPLDRVRMREDWQEKRITQHLGTRRFWFFDRILRIL